MKTIIDPNVCAACGLCADTCPDLYKMGDSFAIVIVDEVPPELESCALDAEEGCPVMAISHVK